MTMHGLSVRLLATAKLITSLLVAEDQTLLESFWDPPAIRTPSLRTALFSCADQMPSRKDIILNLPHHLLPIKTILHRIIASSSSSSSSLSSSSSYHLHHLHHLPNNRKKES